MSSSEETPQFNRAVYIAVLGALTALGPFTIDLYLPAFPVLQEDFGVDASQVQLTLTGTMVGFALGQLLVGPLSDRIGRRLPLTVSAFVHVAASVAIALAPTITMIGALRVLQGFGAAAGGVVSMAMVRDLFAGRHLVHMLSRLALVNGFAPVIAPVIGSQLLLITNWRGIFWVLAAYGVAVGLAVALFVRETLPPSRRLRNQPLLQPYGKLATDRIFVGAVMVASMSSTGLFSYLAASPFLFQDVYGFSEQAYGWIFAINSLGVIVGVQTSSRLMSILGIEPQWILAGATAGQATMALSVGVLDALGAGLWGLAIPLWFYIMATGFAFPAQQVLALSGHPERAGTAASVMGASSFGVAGLVTPLIGVLGVDSAVPMSAVMGGAALLSMSALWLVVRPRSVPKIL